MSSTRGIAYPFLAIPDSCVTERKLLLGRKGGPLGTAGEILENWDYNTDLSVHAAIKLDWQAAMNSLGLAPSGTTLSFVLSIGTGQGRNPRIRWTIARETLSAANSLCEFSCDIPGRQLSGSLHVQLSILLFSAGDNIAAFAPTKSGSRLWTLEHSVLLEGGGNARFPLESTSFAASPRLKKYPDAPWYVQWNDGPLQTDYSAAVRLLVNSDCTSWYERILEGDPLVLQTMIADVAQQLCSKVVAEGDIEDLDDCEPGSVGYQIKSWLELAFGRASPQTLQQLLETNPAGFRAGLFAAFELREAP